MKLRTIGLIVTLALGLLAGSLPAKAQQAGKMPQIGYLHFRAGPKCKRYLVVVVRDTPEPKKEIPVDAYCVRCGFKYPWKIVLAIKHQNTPA